MSLICPCTQLSIVYLLNRYFEVMLKARIRQIRQNIQNLFQPAHVTAILSRCFCLSLYSLYHSIVCITLLLTILELEVAEGRKRFLALQL